MAANTTVTSTGSGAVAAFNVPYTPAEAAAKQKSLNPFTNLNITTTQTTFASTNIPSYAVNLGDFELFTFKVSEKNSPFSIFSVNLNKEGVQTTPALARGFLPGSAIELLNNNLTHVCDVKFLFNFDADLALGLINPLTAIQNAIRNARLNATNMLRNIVYKAVQLIRKAIDAILQALNFDPSGEFSFYWSLGKSIIKKDIAEAVEIVLSYVFLVQQIQQLIAWINSLPDKIAALLAECVKNFTNSIIQVAQTFQSIPDQIANINQAKANDIAAQFTAAGQELLAAVQSKQTSSNLPDGVAAALASNTSDGFSTAFRAHADNVIAYSNSKMSQSMANNASLLYKSP
jgi:hypothetical protein